MSPTRKRSILGRSALYVALALAVFAVSSFISGLGFEYEAPAQVVECLALALVSLARAVSLVDSVSVGEHATLVPVIE